MSRALGFGRGFLALMAMMGLLVACGGGGSDDLGNCPGGNCIDVNYQDPGGPTDPGPADPGLVDVRPDAPLPDEGQDPGVADPGTDQGPTGAFGDPCVENLDCLSGICLRTLTGKVCTILCVENCPDDWSCEQVILSGTESPFACVPPQTSLCRPCSKDADCTGIEGEEDARCLEYGPQGRFCATACATTEGGAGCQQGFTCRDVNFGDQVLQFCLSDAGDCPCLQGFAGLATRCFQTNEFGTCVGDRVCSRAGNEYAWDACTARTPAQETCNDLDDDCNGYIDDGLGEYTCGKGICAHVVQNCVNGVPGVCNEYLGQTAEICNGLNDDCDDETDELWPEKGQPCDGPDADQCKNGIFSCNEGGNGLVCGGDDVNFVEVCNDYDDDCDGAVDEVEDLGTTTCGVGACLHTVANCVGGQVQTCDPMAGYQPDDLPDPDFIDANCDGLDGDASKAIFVDTSTGKDLNPGTQDLPKRTIQAGVNAAADFGKQYVLVSLGVYNETVTLRNGIGLYGQYDAASGWARKPENTTQIKGAGTKGVIAQDISAPTGLHGFLVTSESTSTLGESSYGVYAVNSPGLALNSLTVQAGAGGSGTPGAAGTPGLNGSSGSGGNSGCEYGCDCLVCVGQCGSCDRPLGGAAGASPCGADGGKGGNGGNSGGSGYAGVVGSGTGGGYAGLGGQTQSNGFAGGPGSNGYKGGNGSAGSSIGSIASGGYAPAAGGGGEDGTHGGGGGGGGGGGDNSDFFSCCETYGSSGGGGGGGGCGGKGGAAGGGGGGSFGIYVVGGGIAISKTVVKTGQGGVGGVGGYAGSGGPGGNGGLGGPKGDDDDQGLGAAGGKGGNGGDGGHGGGGGGGPSIGIVCSGASVTLDQVSFQIGQPGEGGYSTGKSGAKGVAGETYGCSL